MTDRLSGIETQWTMVLQANGKNDVANMAQANLIERYGPAIRRYLLASLRDEEAADEVFQEFSLRLVRGDFRNADSSRGKFRSFVKTTLYRLMIDYHRRKKTSSKFGLGKANDIERELAADEDANVDEFLLAWRQSLLDKSWAMLQRIERNTGKPVHTILRCRVDHPELSTKQLQEYLAINSDVVVPPIKSFRVYLHRARKKFAECLLDLVSKSLVEVNRETVEDELIELGLHHFCVPALSDRF